MIGYIVNIKSEHQEWALSHCLPVDRNFVVEFRNNNYYPTKNSIRTEAGIHRPISPVRIDFIKEVEVL